MKKTDKLSKVSLAYIEPALRAAIYDCSDSMEDEEKYENRFNALADDKFSIQEYIAKFHIDEYVKGIKDVIEDEGDEVTDWDEFIESIPGCLPIPYEDIKDKL